MGERITVVGGTDSSIAVTLDGSQALNLAKQFVEELDNYYQSNNLNFLDVTDSPAVDDRIGYGMITQGGAYTAGNGYNYIVAGGHNAASISTDPETGKLIVSPATEHFLEEPVTINSAMNASQSVKILAGNTGGFTYNASLEGGRFVGGASGNDVVFNGNTVNGGDWTIVTGKGNNTIKLGSGNNTVNSDGQDTITASKDSNGQNRVTLNGGVTQDSHSVVDLNKGAAVTDLGFYNTVTVGGGSTIEGGTFGNYTFESSDDSNPDHFAGGTSSSINAANDLQIVQGDSNTINASQSFTFLNGIGNTNANVQGSVAGFGAGGLNYTLNATGAEGGFFVADVGNETLNASGSTSALQIYANTIVGGGDTHFNAIGGSGNDTMVAGTGDATFTGGAGDNLFMFTKDTAEKGNTVITDFSKNGSHDKIALYNYGLDNDSLAQLLSNSKNENGNAVLNLNGDHTITIQGVSVSDLTVDQFEVANTSTVKS